MAKKIDWKLPVLIESLKEPLRLIALALIAWLLTVIIPQIEEPWVPVIVVALRWSDKWLHEYFKEVGSEQKGLLPF